MADVVLYHHIQGLTEGVKAFAEELRQAGHTVHTPDLFDGRTFDSIDEGFRFASTAGFDEISERGIVFAEGISHDVVYAGFSFGAAIAQQLTQTRSGAKGALLIYSCLPVSEYGEWPAGVPVQIHGKESDEFFEEDLPAAQELVNVAENAELFIYPGAQHLFADSSLDAYDPEAADLLMTRVMRFLASV